MTPEEPERQPHKLGLVHVYTGNGKGKTTASLGLALRASGHGMKVLIIQFMKGGKHIGELMAIGERLPNIELSQFGKPCTYSDLLKKGLAECGNCRDCFLTEEEEKEKAEAGMRAAEEASKSASYDILILDEINIVLSKKVIPVERALDLIKNKSPTTELILTGRNAPSEIIQVADFVTEMVEVKHPIVKGVFGRRGIEY